MQTSSMSPRPKDVASRVMPLDESEVLADEQFQSELRTLADAQQRDFDDVERYARECLDG